MSRDLLSLQVASVTDAINAFAARTASTDAKSS